MLLWGLLGAEAGSWHAVGLTSPCLQEAAGCRAILRNESMSRAVTGTKVSRVLLLLLGVGCLSFLSGTTAQTCATGSKAVAIFGGIGRHSCALLVSRGPLSG